MLSAPEQVRARGPLGRQTATLIEQDRGQHGTRVDGATTTLTGCVLVPDGAPSETKGERAATETRWTLYVPRSVRSDVASAVCTVVPGPVDADGQPLRLAVAGPPQPFWKRSGQFSHTQVALRWTVS